MTKEDKEFFANLERYADLTLRRDGYDLDMIYIDESADFPPNWDDYDDFAE